MEKADKRSLAKQATGLRGVGHGNRGIDWKCLAMLCLAHFYSAFFAIPLDLGSEKIRFRVLPNVSV